ncbi:dTDP-4-dehydrorhamnose 3,5-epimerase [Nonlabens sp. Hel1_33_55]|uniref:dTDP-4-dehydrorhamnose 3,5-epimerase n=1 Tax=Nonlabens sp. Hel1_33_55 TaxID=1336802 RepID=UPI000875C187|nr:dTDP-4-dehydrorhamnose 3,5-epimerase [Nonlabens sp. Hel1_33_55]SCX93988.1 dTDP-4-dehydrorhamnose 3,5-epimerase [Nonlabens sp. Hel1_33_55]
MNLKHTEIEGCFLLEPNIIKDERGFFMESFNQQKFEALTGVKMAFVQDNMSHSTYGVIRGMHAQAGEHAQAKLVSVLQGEVLDVAVDIRKESATYGKVVTALLNDVNRHQLFVPRGCLHGFAVLSKQATFFYKCDNFYNKASEIGVKYDDSSLHIDWKIPADQHIISSKDADLPILKDLKL